MRFLVAAVFVGLLSVATAVSASVAAMLPAHLSNLPRELLGLHNAERAQVVARPLVWDEQLASDAAAYARELDERYGRLVHSDHASRWGQGENLWMGTSNRYSVYRMFGGWAGEKRFFHPGVFPDVGRNGDWKAVGHYTQVVWPGTQRVGCGIHQGAKWDYLVCRYLPAGNVRGEFVP